MENLIRNKKGQFVKGHKSLAKKGYKRTEECKRKMSEARKGKNTWMKGKKHTEESKKKMSESQKGKKLSEETKKRISKANKGKKKPPLTKEHKRNISLSKKGSIPWNKGLNKKTDSRIVSRKGFKHSEEARLKISLSNKGKKLSQETKDKISEAHKKIIHTEEWNRNVVLSRKGKSFKWSEEVKRRHRKTAKTPINKLIRVSKEFKKWRELVFERDNWVCQKYGIRGLKLHPHHIKNFAQYPELRFVIDNGITLSEKAHLEFHKIYGKRNNTREQLIEFLNEK